MLRDVHDGSCETDAVQVKAVARHADVPDGLYGKAAQDNQEKEDRVLDARQDDAEPDGQLKPADGEDAGVESQDGNLDQELDQGVDLLADPVILVQGLGKHVEVTNIAIVGTLTCSRGLALAGSTFQTCRPKPREVPTRRVSVMVGRRE